MLRVKLCEYELALYITLADPDEIISAFIKYRPSFNLIRKEISLFMSKKSGLNG